MKKETTHAVATGRSAAYTTSRLRHLEDAKTKGLWTGKEKTRFLDISSYHRRYDVEGKESPSLRELAPMCRRRTTEAIWRHKNHRLLRHARNNVVFLP